jgi:hypothetical protein
VASAEEQQRNIAITNECGWAVCFETRHSNKQGATKEKQVRFNYENNQQDALYRLIYYSKSAPQVSSDVFAYHREHLTVFTASGSVHPS